MGLALVSCVKETISVPDREYFWRMIVDNVLVCPVISLSELEMEKGEAIFVPDYRAEIKKSGYSMTVTKVSDRDSTWTVEGSTGRTRFNATVRMDGRNSDGLCEWSATTIGDYDEGNGYKATLEISTPATFFWEKYVSRSEITHYFLTSGKGILQTFKNGHPVENCEVSFTKMRTSW